MTLTLPALARPAATHRWRQLCATGVIGPWHVVAAASICGALLSATTTLRDPDLYWHVVAGAEIWHRHTLRGIGAHWSYSHHNSTWTTTQWLSECLLAGAHELLGWRGIMDLRLLLSALFVAGLVRLLLMRRAGSIWAPLVFSLTVLTAAPSLQERPQLASFLLLIWLARWAASAVLDGQAPRAAPLLAVTWLWANLHGLWVLVPAVLAVLAAGAALEHERGTPWTQTQRFGFRAAGCLLVAALTPAGPWLVLSPLRLHSATAFISEWQPTTPWHPLLLGFDLTALALVVAWAGERAKVPVLELLYCVALICLGLTAFRNVAPALLLLSPIAVHRLTSSMPRRSATGSSRERALLAGGLAAIVAAGALGASVRAFTGPLIDREVPVNLVNVLAADGLHHRVLNDYNTGGAVIFWGRGRASVGVDGRADFYGGTFVRRYLELLALRPGWTDRLRALHPDAALLAVDAPLTEALQARGWTQAGRDRYHVLLRAAGSAAAPPRLAP